MFKAGFKCMVPFRTPYRNPHWKHSILFLLLVDASLPPHPHPASCSPLTFHSPFFPLGSHHSVQAWDFKEPRFSSVTQSWLFSTPWTAAHQAAESLRPVFSPNDHIWLRKHTNTSFAPTLDQLDSSHSCLLHFSLKSQTSVHRATPHPTPPSTILIS